MKIQIVFFLDPVRKPCSNTENIFTSSVKFSNRVDKEGLKCYKSCNPEIGVFYERILYKKDADEFRRYMGILNEGFQHKLNLVIDGQAALEERLSNKIESAANGLRKEMKDMKQELKSEINGVRNEIISHRGNTEVHAQKARAKKSLGK